MAWVAAARLSAVWDVNKAHEWNRTFRTMEWRGACLRPECAKPAVTVLYTINMFYYFIWVRSNRYHGNEPLTYESDTRLSVGSIVYVELQKEVIMGVVSGITTKPRFATKAISEIVDLPPLPLHLLKLAEWLQSYYPAPLGIIAQQLLPAQLTAKHITAPDPSIILQPDISLLPTLTAEQVDALEHINEASTYVLHGKTGTGKTRVYSELAVKTIEQGKSAIILTPEISLTAQLSQTMRQVFGDRVVVLHSQQTPVERQHAWLRCLKSDEPLVVIGPRSALFSPVAKIGLIIMDEAHESAYKQEQAPQYQTVRVAAYLARLQRATLVLGSATPSINDYYLAEQKQRSIITMTTAARPNDHPEREIMIVDRKDRGEFSRSPLMSNKLIKAVEDALHNGEQSLLYLNRRGTARLILCENCGWQANCPHCEVPLTYHGDKHQLRCHSCNYHATVPTTCPECGHVDVMYRSAGTKAIVEEAQRLFPDARIARFDTDNDKADRFENQYEDVKNGKVDILVGTQLLAKGLDLPKLTTLGILLADTSLYMPDYTASERTFQLLTQVIGRVGRGHLPGRAIIQTYHPDHPILKAAIEENYAAFYKPELESRRQFDFPPFVHLLKISVRRASSSAAEAAALKVKTELGDLNLPITIEGPAPSFYERVQNKHQWQLVVKTKERSALLDVIKHLPANCSYDIDPQDLL